MTKKFGQPSQSDITFWGIAAVAAGGIAVLSSIVSALVPAGFFGGLHASRIDGSTMNQLRAQVERLQNQQQIMSRQTSELRSQFRMAERNRADVNIRVGALETTIPQLLEVVPPGAEIDPLAVTAAIDSPDAETFDAEGGSVAITQSPLFPDAGDEATANSSSPLPPPLSQPAPPLLAPAHAAQDTPQETPDNASAALATSAQTQDPEPAETAGGSVAAISQTRFGLAIGDDITMQTANEKWADISRKIGPLLIGLRPAVSDPLGNNSLRIVVGPITNFSEAQMLCGRINRVGITCLPVQYADQDVTALQ